LIWENVFHETVTEVSPAYATRTWELIVLFMAALDWKMSVMNATMALKLLRDRILSVARLQNCTREHAKSLLVLRVTSNSTKEKPARTTINIQVFRSMKADVNEERTS
jgi:hypothetical protein